LILSIIYSKFKGKHSLLGIAKMFNLVSHATVLHSIKSAKNLQETDYEFRQMFEKIEDKIKQ